MQQQPADSTAAKVYVLTAEWDHEGERVLAVASTVEKAKASIPHRYPGSAIADQYNVWAAAVDGGEPEWIAVNYVQWGGSKYDLGGWADIQ